MQRYDKSLHCAKNSVEFVHFFCLYRKRGNMSACRARTLQPISCSMACTICFGWLHVADNERTFLCDLTCFAVILLALPFTSDFLPKAFFRGVTYSLPTIKFFFS